MKLLLLIGLLFTAAAPDAVYLKSGAVVDGDIIGKSEVLLKIYVEAFHRAMAIEKDKIDSIELDGRTYTFDNFRFTAEEYNPTFKVSPKVRRVTPVVRDTAKLFEKDVFDEAVRQNGKKDLRSQRFLNFFFNAPARWGSVGIGYSYYPGLFGSGATFQDSGFLYDGRKFDINCLNAEIRKNFRKWPGTLIIDFGYGRKALKDSADIQEYASLRYVSLRYSYCQTRWLFAPGITAGCMFSKLGITQEITAPSLLVRDISLDDRLFKPLLGLDLNFYDVVTAHATLDVLKWKDRRFVLGVAFLLPFLQ